jgi:hypothetical protein
VAGRELGGDEPSSNFRSWLRPGRTCYVTGAFVTFVKRKQKYLPTQIGFHIFQFDLNVSPFSLLLKFLKTSILCVSAYHDLGRPVLTFRKIELRPATASESKKNYAIENDFCHTLVLQFDLSVLYVTGMWALYQPKQMLGSPSHKNEAEHALFISERLQDMAVVVEQLATVHPNQSMSAN